MTRLERAQEAVEESGLDGWLLYDFRHSNPVLWEILGSSIHSTRRIFLFVSPGAGPSLLAHQVDAEQFSRPGLDVVPYQDAHDLQHHLETQLRGRRRVAMEYSPMAALPAVSYADAGTVELIRSIGVEVVSSAELAQAALCRLDPDSLASHERSAARLCAIVRDAFAFIGRQAREVDEWTVAEHIREQFGVAGMETDAGPIVAVNAHAGNPHYQPAPQGSAPIRHGDWVLIDLWAKEPGGTYADITWVAQVGGHPTEAQRQVYEAVTGARDAAVDFLTQTVAAGRYPEGWEVDRRAREYIERAGFGTRFTHRLGHSLGSMVHGMGANLDGYETRDTRRLVPGLAFTIEPGIYLPEFGVRSEIDLYMEESGPRITTDVQREIVFIV